MNGWIMFEGNPVLKVIVLLKISWYYLKNICFIYFSNWVMKKDVSISLLVN